MIKLAEQACKRCGFRHPAGMEGSSCMAAARVEVENIDVLPARPTVVCLCGSTRFWREFQRASLAETLAGRIVLSIGAASGTDDEHFGNLPAEEYARIKEDLDQLHLRKVEMADEVLFLNVDGYVGESTARELAHAYALGKRIRFLEPEMGKVTAALERAAVMADANQPRLIARD